MNLNEYMNLEDVNVNEIIGARPVIEPKETRWAKVVSIALHPLLMMVYLMLFLFACTDFGTLFRTQFFNFFIPVVLLSGMVPVAGLYFLKRSKLLSNYRIDNRGERFLPFFIILLSYMALVYFFWMSDLHIFFLWYIALLISPILLLVVGSGIRIYWPISMHMIGIGGLIGGIMAVCYCVKAMNPYLLFIILFILAGCLGTARLILRRSTPMQVYAGFALGFGITWLSVWVATKYTLSILKLFF